MRPNYVTMGFLSVLKTGTTILLDGAMGTELDRRGLMLRGASNLVAPDAVLDIHRDYLACGCHALTTNTLTMNRVYIETHKVGVGPAEVNLAGARLARQAAGEQGFVLGDMSSTGQMLEPYGTYTEQQFCAAFAEQAAALAEGGVDAFLVETMFDLREALCALRACKQNHRLPVIVSMAFSTTANGGRTIMGDSAADCARQLAENGADAVGANCGSIDPFEMAEIVRAIKYLTSLPVLAQPNAGTPELIDGRTVFDMGPECFAEGIAECLSAGATILGGCCGTTPAHIRAVAASL